MERRFHPAKEVTEDSEEVSHYKDHQRWTESGKQALCICAETLQFIYKSWGLPGKIHQVDEQKGLGASS